MKRALDAHRTAKRALSASPSFYGPFIKFFSWLCLALLGGGVPAQAQVSYPGLLNSQFDDSPVQMGMQATALQPTFSALPSPGISWEERDELTVHTDKGRRGLLDDLHANGSLVTVRAALGPSAASPQLLLRRQSLETGLTDNEGSQDFRGRGHFRQPEARLLWPLSHHGLAYAGYRQTIYNLDGTTRLYDNIFTIFPSPPPFRYEGREQLVLVGLRVPLSPDWTVETIAGQKAEPSRLTLHQDGTAIQVILPLHDAGATGLLAARRRLPGGSALLLYVGGEALRGSAAVEREAAHSIGAADTTHNQQSGGLGWQHPFGGRRSLGVFLETARDRWQTQGFVPDPGALQTGYRLTSDLHYGASYVIRKDLLGVRWSQIYSGHQVFHGTLQLIQLSLRGDADYAVRYFGLGKAGQTSYQQNRLRVLLLRGSYAIPWNRFRLGLEASQLIPLGAGSGGSASSGGVSAGPDSDPRTTSGGWALNLRIERLL